MIQINLVPFFTLGIFLIIGMSACQVERQYENDNMLSTADLTLTASNHPHGYTRKECFMCHLPQNIHQVDRLGAPSFPSARPLVEQHGITICAACHGSNGVSP